MSILVDWQIEAAINDGEIKVTPFDASLINPNSLDLRLGGNFSSLFPTCTAELISYTQRNQFDGNEEIAGQKIAIDPLDKTSFQFIPRHNGRFLLLPGHFVIASLLEDITLSDSICAEIRGKSSLGRLGLDNSSVAGWVDAGWSGVLTIELSNHGDHPLILTKGMKIGQMVFHRTERCEKPYGKVGRYQNQKPGQGSHGL